jgi:hypothetical protein
MEALTKQNGVRLLGKFKKKLKKKVKTDLPYLSFYKRNRKPTYFFLPNTGPLLELAELSCMHIHIVLVYCTRFLHYLAKVFLVDDGYSRYLPLLKERILK